MFYLIDREIVCQIEKEKFPICESENLYWVNYASGSANIGDKYHNGRFIPKYNLEELRKIKWLAVKLKRHSVINSGVTHNGMIFDSDQTSFSRMHSTIILEENFPIEWTLFDNTHASINLDDLIKVIHLISKKTKLAFLRSIELRKLINSSDDPNSIDIESGWTE